ncbi:hypothetical protein [Rufibacter psychrotolerans]|uniref:hypothetical protein n=1 Tax=Rufibacter psychrotolerans TaxID=2812556 RepID=UPI00196889FB|nr:hypothetical protein [Rufibacter sp. SYSU D00308]
MKNTVKVLAAASLLCLAACSKEKSPATTENGSFKPATFPVNAAPAGGANQPATAGQPAQGAQPEATAGLNPPHGQPGHRCDIEVGAPLNSPAKSAPAATGTAPAALPPAPVLPSAPPISTAKGLNPPHGQPGHDCSIAVGAPLNK